MTQMTDTTEVKTATGKPSFVRRLYNWILHWADTRWGSGALFILAFAESSFFPIPPDVLLIALCLGCVRKSFKYAMICTAGSVAGAILGYVIGHLAWIDAAGQFTAFAEFFFNNIPGFTHEVYDEVRLMYDQYSFWVVFTAGFTPIPYKLITITSGVFNINFVIFIVASIISRGARFFLISWLLWKFGPSIKSFIDKYLNLIAIAVTVLLIGAFVLIKYSM